MHFTQGFDAAKGNLLWRKDNIRNIREDFSYDNLNRLTGYGGKSASYDLKGNITQKSDVGTSFLYVTPGKPYALSGVNTGANTAIPLRNQSVPYTSFKRPASIAEGEYTAAFAYNGAGERKRMELKKNGVTELDRHYLLDNYEIDDLGAGGIREKLYLGGDAYTAPAVAVKEGGNWNIYYLCRDYLGSITHIATSSGSVVQELSYDAWGRLRNPINQLAYAPDGEPALFLGRGYTGHEHLPWFGLINMNARLYDPALGRFLSPDPFVQAPDFSQNFNRYSYCLNNPLKYTDPDGEWNWLVAGIGFVFGYVSYGLMNGDWGWKALGNGVLTGAMWGIGYTSGVAKAGITPLSYAAQSAVTSTVNSFMPSMSIPIGNNFSINAGFGFGISPHGLVGGMNFSGTYHSGDFALTGGFGASGNMTSWGGGISYDEVGVSYYRTTFGNATGPDGKSNNQTVGGFGLNIGDFSLRVENDLKVIGIGGDGGDRWRTSAVEIGIKNFVIGTYVYTNEPDKDLKRDESYESKFWKKSSQAYSDSKGYSSPLYVGVKQGGRVTRMGFDHPVIQDITQNGVHLLIKSPLFYTPYGEYSSAYRYSGYYNPYSLYYR
jgi:RHS repeat-associated protein